MKNVSRETLRPFANFVLAEAHLPELPNFYSGKVRENYDLPDGTRVLIATDRVSAFDYNLALIPFKGQVLTAIARFWFEATEDLCKNHVRSTPDPNVVIAEKLSMMPVEIVVRDYLAGTTSTSILPMYESGAREIYGLRFPDGLRANQKLPETILTPTSKAVHGAHDAPLTIDKILSLKLLTQTQWEEVSAKALALFARGRELAAQRGLILADTKYEFGFDAQGEMILADEIHTPDSSRYWRSESYQKRFEAGEKPESLDKDFIRNWVNTQCDPYKDKIPPIPEDVILDAALTYIDSFETITGLTFELPENKEPVLQRVRKNLGFLWKNET